MIRRRRGSLIGTAARTAVIAGTATSVSGKVARKQQEASQAAKRVAASGARTESDRLDELERLNALRKSGALTAREFDREKAKILAD